MNRFKPSFLIVAILLIGIGFSRAQETYDSKSIKVSIRTIGHRVLLNSGDSTSLVLPIEDDEDGYRIRFGTELEIMPEELVMIIDSVMKETGFEGTYIIEVEDCNSGNVVYSNKIYDTLQSGDMTCATRLLAKDCYELVLTLDEELNYTPTLKTKDEEKEPASWKMALVFGFGFVLMGGVLFLLFKRKASKINPNEIRLGNYRFDKHNEALIFDEQRIELTGKESELLMLLYQSVNETVERDVILNKVWGDEGDYVGRTLDVFISKLRKKLEFDPNVNIKNIRGVGYKLVLGQ